MRARITGVAMILAAAGVLLGHDAALVAGTAAMACGALQPRRARFLWLVLGMAACVLASVGLGQMVSMEPLAIAMMSVAAVAAPFDLVAPPGERTLAAARMLAHTLAITALALGPGWTTIAAAALVVAAIGSFVQPPSAAQGSSGLARLLLGATACGVATAGLLSVAGLDAATPAQAFVVAGLGLGVLVVSVEARGVLATARADARRAAAFAGTAPCAEVDVRGTVIYCNERWGIEFGADSLGDRTGDEGQAAFASAFDEAQLGAFTVTREVLVADGEEARHAYQLEVSPACPERDSCLLTVRVERDRPSQAEVDALRTQATTDPLTGLLNRRGLETELGDRLGRADTWVVYADLDGFKAVNDGLGHGAGDEVLCEISRRLGAIWRSDDALARVGGDEFVVLTQTPITPERLNACEQTLSFREGDYPISASLGLVRGCRGANPDAVLAAADRAMYTTKRTRKGLMLDDRVIA